MTRTFIALEMNGAVQRHLRGVIRQVALDLPGVRWIDPAGIHLTLAFLGELDDTRLAKAIETARLVAQRFPPFSYTLTRLGIFGSPRQPRIIWMGIAETGGAGTLSRLHRALNQELAQRGFELDQKAFSPHLTLARVKVPLSIDEQKRFQALLAGDQHKLVSSDEYAVRAIQVIKSELSRAGAQYTVLHTCSLGSG